MDVSDASYYIQRMKKNENKGSQMGHIKKIFKTKYCLAQTCSKCGPRAACSGEQTYCRKQSFDKMPKAFLGHFAEFFFSKICFGTKCRK
jgi:hypothetical protein